jgi:hypothetical protein
VSDLDQLREAGDRLHAALFAIFEDGQWPPDREIADALQQWETLQSGGPAAATEPTP